MALAALLAHRNPPEASFLRIRSGFSAEKQPKLRKMRFCRPAYGLFTRK